MVNYEWNIKKINPNWIQDSNCGFSNCMCLIMVKSGLSPWSLRFNTRAVSGFPLCLQTHLYPQRSNSRCVQTQPYSYHTVWGSLLGSGDAGVLFGRSTELHLPLSPSFWPCPEGSSGAVTALTGVTMATSPWFRDVATLPLSLSLSVCRLREVEWWMCKLRRPPSPCWSAARRADSGRSLPCEPCLRTTASYWSSLARKASGPLERSKSAEARLKALLSDWPVLWGAGRPEERGDWPTGWRGEGLTLWPGFWLDDFTVGET